MPRNEDRAITEFPELTPLEKSLAALAPKTAELDRQALFFRAGEAAAMKAFAGRRPLLRLYGWPAAFTAMTAVAAVLLALLCRRETTGANSPAAGVLPQTAAAPAAPVVWPETIAPSDSRIAAMIDYARLRDEIVRDDAITSLPYIAAPANSAADSAKPLSTDDLLKQIIGEE